LNSAKQEQDVMIIRLYLITLIVLPMNTLIGFHSMNIHIPANGDMENHRRADGSQAPFSVFFIIIFGCFIIGALFVLFIWKFIFRPSAISFNRSFPKLFYFL
jgi:magnesium transporter